MKETGTSAVRHVVAGFSSHFVSKRLKKVNHIVISVLGSAGDLFPFLAIGSVLLARGYHVTVLTNPYYMDTVMETGLPFAPLGTVEEFVQTANNPEIFGKKATEVFLEAVVRATGRAYEWLATNTVAGETVILSNPFVLGSKVANEKLGIPLVCAHVGPAGIWSIYSPPKTVDIPILQSLPPVGRWLLYWALDRFVLDPVLAPEVNRIRNQLGLKGKMRRIYSRWLMAADLQLGLFPEWFADRQVDWPKPLEMTGFSFYEPAFSLPEDLKAFLNRDVDHRSSIVFTAGSANRHVQRFYEVAAETCRVGNYRGVFIGPLDKMPKDLPDSVFAAAWAPFGPLFNEVQAVVHTAGIGTGALAMRAGTPQLLHALAFDQPDNEDRFLKLGIAMRFDDADNPVAIASRLKELLIKSEVKTNCLTIKRRFENEPVGAEAAAARIITFIQDLNGGQSDRRQRRDG